MTGYVRKDTTNNIADGNVINAADLDAEFDGVQDAFNASTGHNHDGTSGEGAPITALGPTQDVTISSILLAPKTNNTVDIGSSALKFKDLFLAGNASIGGTLAVTGVATLTAQPILSSLTASRAVFTDGSKGLVSNAITGTGNVVMSASPTLTGTVGGASLTLSSLTSGRVTYAGTSGLLQDSANLLYAGTDLTVYGVTVGRGAGAVSTNTAVGASALAANSSGARNVAIGNLSLATNNANNNTAVGHNTLNANSSGVSNTAFGTYSLQASTASANSGYGYATLGSNTSGANNVAVGSEALSSNTTASQNTAVGYQAAYSNTTGTLTVAGYLAGYSNTTGTNNAAFGDRALAFTTTGASNTAVGTQALNANTTASNNTAVGYEAAYTSTVATGVTAVGKTALKFNTGSFNTGVGLEALLTNTTGVSNTAVGVDALYSNTTASNNSAFGRDALVFNTTGASNVAVGAYALQANTTASNNTAVGYQALYANTTATFNNALGYLSLTANTTGASNNSFGSGALSSNTTGGFNAAFGHQALAFNTTASNNTAVGYQAGYSNTTGASNTFIGQTAGYSTTGGGNTFIGAGTGSSVGAGYFVTTGTKNTIIGGFHGNQGGLDIRTASNFIVLSDGDGNPRGIFNGSGEFYIGTATANLGRNLVIGGTSSTARVIPAVDNVGSVGDVSYRWSAIYAVNGTIQTSDGREKNTIQDSNLGLSFVKSLRPVSYKWNVGENVVTYDEDKNPVVTPRAGVRTHYGFIAQEVKESLGDQDFGGYVEEPNQRLGLRYDQFIAPLVKAIQEQQAIIESLKARLDAANL
jgi:hypothetical protein